MVFNWFEWKKDGKDVPSIHPTQKPISVLKRLIEIFTDEGDVVIDPVAGSASTLRAAFELGRNAYGFEVDKGFYKAAKEKMLVNMTQDLFTIQALADKDAEREERKRMYALDI